MSVQETLRRCQFARGARNRQQKGSAATAGALQIGLDDATLSGKIPER
jgi:hypothetical protein